MENKESPETSDKQVSSDTEKPHDKTSVDTKTTDPQDDSEGTRSPGKTDRGL